MLLIFLSAVAAEHVDLRFGWVPEMRCAETSEVRSVVGDGSPLVVRTASTVRTTLDAEGLRVSSVPVKVETRAPRGGDARYAALLAGLVGDRPDFVVDDEGRLLAVPDAEAHEERVRAEVRAMASQLDPAARVSLAGLVDRVEGGDAFVRRDWSAQLGDWDGQRLYLGETTTFATRMGSPSMGAAQVRVPTEVRAEGRVPCVAGEADARCVVVTWTREADGREVADAALAQARALHPGSKVAVRRAGIQESGRAVVDPDTLQVYERRMDVYEDLRVMVDGVALAAAPRMTTEIVSTRCEVERKREREAVAAR